MKEQNNLPELPSAMPLEQWLRMKAEVVKRYGQFTNEDHAHIRLIEAADALSAIAADRAKREGLEEALSGVLERYTQLSTDALDEVVPKLADVVFGEKK